MRPASALDDPAGKTDGTVFDWDSKSETGAMFHLLRLLELEGRIGVTAIGDSPEQAHELYLRLARLLDRLAAGTAVTSARNDGPSFRGDEEGVQHGA